MDSGGIPSDWRPSPPPPHGSLMWKYNTGVQWMISNGQLKDSGPVSRLIRLPVIEGVDLGYMAIRRSNGGFDYIHSENMEYPQV